MKKLLPILVLAVLAGCAPKDVVIERDDFTVTLTQAPCTNEVVIKQGVPFVAMLGMKVDASKLKAGHLETKSGEKAELCYIDAKDSPTHKRFVIDERGGFGNFEDEKK